MSDQATELVATFQSIAASIPDPPDYLEDDNGDVIDCAVKGCVEWAEGEYNGQPYCAPHARDEYEWDRAEDMRAEVW